MTSSRHPDDLKQVKGIGLITETRLHKVGIYTFAQLAKLSSSDLVDQIPGLSEKRIRREKWLEQARQLAARKSRAQPKHKRPGETAAPPRVDDFELIGGLCPEVEHSLNAAGIMTYGQLAELTVEKLANLIPGLSAKRETCQSWLKQAQHLALRRGMVARRKRAIQRAGRHDSFAIELCLDADHHIQYTRVTHTRCEVKAYWPGWDVSHLIDFVTRHVRFDTPTQELTASIAEDPATDSTEVLAALAAPTNAQLSNSNSPAEAGPSFIDTVPDISKNATDAGEVLRICQLVMTPIDSDVPRTSIPAGEAFNCHVIMDAAKVPLTSDVPIEYTVTVWVKRLGDKARQIGGEEHGTYPAGDKLSCTVEIVLASRGLYRLEAIVALRLADPAPATYSRLTATGTSCLLQVI